jgi:hypothetical protein
LIAPLPPLFSWRATQTFEKVHATEEFGKRRVGKRFRQ